MKQYETIVHIAVKWYWHNHYYYLFYETTVNQNVHDTYIVHDNIIIVIISFSKQTVNIIISYSHHAGCFFYLSCFKSLSNFIQSKLHNDSYPMYVSWNEPRGRKKKKSWLAFEKYTVFT